MSQRHEQETGEEREAGESELEALRVRIDDIDRQLVDLMAERLEVARAIAEVKREHRIPVRLPARIRAVIARNEARARERELPEGLIARLYAEIIETTCRIEEEQLATEDGASPATEP